MSKHSRRKHAIFSPSSAHRWLRCFGAAMASAKAKPRPPGPAAIEGTKAHECLEFIVERFKNLEGAKKSAKLAKDKEGNRRWNDDMIEYGAEAAKIIFDLKPSPTSKLYVETRVKLSEDVYGSVDYAWVEEWGTLVVIDYKYGKGKPVLPIDDEGVENEQTMIYAGALAKKFNYDFDKVELAIIQPRVWREDPNPLSKAVVKIKRLKEFEREAHAAVIEGKKPNAKRVAGDHCEWCPAAPTCPETSLGQMEAAGIVFDVKEGIQKLPKIEALTDNTLTVTLKAAGILENWIKELRAHAYNLACEGGKIPDWKLVGKESRRYWLDDAEKFALKKFGEKIYEKSFKSPAALERAFGKKAKDFTKRFTSKKATGYTLVPKTDKRKEVTEINPVAFDLEQ